MRTRFTRGSAVESREIALQSGLNLPNTSRTSGKLTPGLYFHVGEEGESISAQGSACGEGYYKPIPVVADFTLTPANFHIFQHRIWMFSRGKQDLIRDIGSIGRSEYWYGGLPTTEALVNLEGIAHEDLVELGVQVGFLDLDRGWEYRPYAEWTEKLGVCAQTREEKLQQEGKSPQWIK